jgi:site-specific DNA-methyltransferase (adenine-specific)
VSNITLHNQDCMVAMRGMKDRQFDLALVDPPYGIDIVDQFKKTIKSESSMFNLSKGIVGNGEWDHAIPGKEYFTELLRVSKNQIIWGGNYFIEYLHNTRCLIIWDKMNGTNPMADAEIAWTSFSSSVKMFRMHHFSAGYDAKIHPTQKPVRLYEWILKHYAKPGDTILDTHAGSFSLGIACDIMGYSCTAYEIDRDYYLAAKARLERHQTQAVLPLDTPIATLQAQESML